MYYVYIIKSNKDGPFYIGQCEELDERVRRHNRGYTKSTKAKIPWHIVYYEVYINRCDAIRREIQIKKQKSRKYILDLISKEKVAGD
ncbi:MAG: GIY-YIG nuclease family protein [Nitrospiraceae bacterium]|nr:MAG: GIY-YIG nuclease family protein [Nitrospiraceae bacterium]